MTTKFRMKNCQFNPDDYPELFIIKKTGHGHSRPLYYCGNCQWSGRRQSAKLFRQESKAFDLISSMSMYGWEYSVFQVKKMRHAQND